MSSLAQLGHSYGSFYKLRHAKRQHSNLKLLLQKITKQRRPDFGYAFFIQSARVSNVT
jgi:hypothetical protein